MGRKREELIKNLKYKLTNRCAYAIVIGFAQTKLIPQLLRSASKQHIEHMIVSLVRTLRANTTLLEQIMRDIPANHLTLAIVVHLDEFAETGRVVVACGLGIAEGLQHGIG